MALLSKKVSYHTRLLIQSIGVIVVLIGIQPLLWKFVHTSAEQLQNQRTQEEQYANLQARLKTIEETYANDSLLLDQLSIVFPDTNSTPQVVERLEQLADRGNVEMNIQSIQEEAFTDKKDKSKMTMLVVTAEVFGRADQLLEYVDATEQVQEATSIRNWSLAAAPAAEGVVVASPRYRLLMNVLFYLQSST